MLLLLLALLRLPCLVNPILLPPCGEDCDGRTCWGPKHRHCGRACTAPSAAGVMRALKFCLLASLQPVDWSSWAPPRFGFSVGSFVSISGAMQRAAVSKSCQPSAQGPAGRMQHMRGPSQYATGRKPPSSGCSVACSVSNWAARRSASAAGSRRRASAADQEGGEGLGAVAHAGARFRLTYSSLFCLWLDDGVVGAACPPAFSTKSSNWQAYPCPRHAGSPAHPHTPRMPQTAAPPPASRRGSHQTRRAPGPTACPARGSRAGADGWVARRVSVAPAAAAARVQQQGLPGSQEGRGWPSRPLRTFAAVMAAASERSRRRRSAGACSASPASSPPRTLREGGGGGSSIVHASHEALEAPRDGGPGTQPAAAPGSQPAVLHCSGGPAGSISTRGRQAGRCGGAHLSSASYTRTTASYDPPHAPACVAGTRDEGHATTDKRRSWRCKHAQQGLRGQQQGRNRWSCFWS